MKSNFAFELLLIQNSVFISSTIYKEGSSSCCRFKRVGGFKGQKTNPRKKKKIDKKEKNIGDILQILFRNWLLKIDMVAENCSGMDVRDFKFVLSIISDLISSKVRLRGTRLIESDEWLALTLQYLPTGAICYIVNLIQELLIKDRHGFQEMFWMDVKDFKFVLSILSDLISSKERLGGTRLIESDERLALTHRCNMFYSDDKLMLRKPKAQCFEKKRFKDRWNYPHTFGAIEGKHVRIQKLKNGESFCYNYKHTHKFWISGPDYKCLYADIGSNKRVNDSGIWNKNALPQGILNGIVGLPESCQWCKCALCFCGGWRLRSERIYDEAFSSTRFEWIKAICNYRHSRAYKISESLFWILTNRWRIFFASLPHLLSTTCWLKALNQPMYTVHINLLIPFWKMRNCRGVMPWRNTYWIALFCRSSSTWAQCFFTCRSS